jgi:hypothetical protein
MPDQLRGPVGADLVDPVSPEPYPLNASLHAAADGLLKRQPLGSRLVER